MYLKTENYDATINDIYWKGLSDLLECLNQKSTQNVTKSIVFYLFLLSLFFLK